MNSLMYLRGRRMWVVRDYSIWGLKDDAEIFYLGSETVDSTNRLMFGTSTIGGLDQNINFADMIDWKGNALPESINAPRIIFRPRSQYNVFLVGEESSTGFRVAREQSAIGPVTTDMFIFETGD